MRQIGTISQQQAAEVFSGYLLTLGIKSQVDPEGDQWGVWIYDEDRIPQGREELSAYLQNPGDPKYATALQRAAELRAEADRKRQSDNVVHLSDRWVTPRGIQPVVAVLLAAAILVGLGTNFGDSNKNLVARLKLSEDSGPRMPEVRRGQVWRLVTPIFLHHGLLHIVFNLWMLQVLGNPIEFRRGSLNAAAIVLLIAVTSNLVQFGLSAVQQSLYPGNFGGLSGVVYGLFGYAWMKGRYDPAAGLWVPQSTTFIMLVWLVVCMLGFADSVNEHGQRIGIANGAHLGGLLTGVVLALAPLWWRSLTRRQP